MRTNNIDRFRINGNGQFYMFGLGSTGTGFLTTDATGLVQRTQFTGNANQVLLGNGTFGTLPSSSYFTLNGVNQLYTPYKLGVGVLLPNEMLEVNGNGVFNGTVTTQEIIISDVAMAKDRLLFRNSGMLMEGYNPTDGTRNEIASISQPLYINSMTSMFQNTIINSDNSGNVGIGTSTPESKLDVNGSAVFRTGDIKLKDIPLSDGSTEEYLFVKSDGSVVKAGLTYPSADGSNVFVPCKTDEFGNIIYETPVWQNGPQKIVVTNSQCKPDVKVGIGLANPQSKLHIKLSPGYNTKPLIVENSVGYKVFQVNADGLVYAREFKVNLDAAWPDYVFDESYKLRPLSEVKQFIIANKHLPNVPSAEEIKDNGLSLGEGNKILMEKVEELTLYLIQLEESLKSQQELIELQQKEIQLLKNSNK